jgi:hypothetical protein
MKGWAGGMDNLTTERTPLVIAAEINMITCQTKKILFAGAIEIGRRLQEGYLLRSDDSAHQSGTYRSEAERRKKKRGQPAD